ncbi:thioredoxin domain-containing protein 11 isoform X2 [Anthonomus grandis grandis]|uniref:thioredoxin domain-containing protein 11 isoform X2 n=1 Tax=Anthonomus grandis grandis TaxID=2921223 RepID=UPI002165F321|nr:thioredoxin domain-containing protein 11 isoform X2 [Anthonomus grandis grandis]XP_050300519.1 thioredoxin domain-containing protein 11 isoform X2 [Anthonomus grandis grandis]
MSWLKRRLCGAKKTAPLSHESGDNERDIVNKNVDFRPDNVNNNLKKKKRNKYMVKMKNFLRELALFCVFLLAYGAVYKEPPKISKPPKAYPFFPTNSAVTDFYYGDLTKALSLAKKITPDISFIMYYAPWDAQSQAARKEFLLAAEHLQDSVAFIAVNCWQPESDCKGSFAKIVRWPVMVIYLSVNNAIQYNGPLLAPHMISFLKKIMVPIRRADPPIFNFEEAYVVAEINASPNSAEYSVYYKTAIKCLESEPFGRISFYLKPVQVTKNTLSVYMWEQQRILEIEPSDWKPEVLLQWIFKVIKTPITWISPPEVKSVTLAHKLQTGPTLIMFTPKNPLSLQYDYFMMLQDIAQQYQNCENWLLNFDIEAKRLDHLLTYKNLKSTCLGSKTETSLTQIAVTTSATPFLNSTSAKLSKPLGKLELNCGLSSNLKLPSICQNFKAEQCFEIFPHHEDNFGKKGKELDEDLIADDYKVYETSLWKPNKDPKSMENLKKRQKYENCKTFLAAQKVYPEVFVPDDPVDSEDINVSDFACSNNSVKFIVMDSLRYYVFAERLGVNLFNRKDMSAVVIVDEQAESHYIMDTPITSRNVKLFLQKYNESALIRSKKSIVDTPAKNTPAYNFVAINDTSVINLDELNSKNFLDVVLDNRNAVVVLYYSKQCSFCNGISYTFLTLARKLSYVDNIRFTRIDGDENILPWEYTMEEYPSILFFPVNCKEETRVFPTEVPITVPNLLAFMLANMNATMKLTAMYSVCLHTPGCTFHGEIVY